jgi:hypothetical protein
VAGSASGNSQTWAVSGNVTAKPGDYPVSVAVTDDTGVVGKSTFSIKVKPEDSQVTYTGDALAFGDSVQFRATVRDITDAAPGDVRTGNVSFAAGGRTLCTAPLGLLGTASTDASGSCTAKLPNGVRDVTVSVGGNYTGTATAPVETLKPQNRLIIGDGSLKATGSAGTYRADNGSRTDFKLALAYVKAFNGASGVSIVSFTSGGKRYEIRSLGVDSFGTKSGALDVRSKATLFDAAGHQVASGLTLRLTGSTGGPGSLAITLSNGDTLLFSSSWTGAKTQETSLSRGTLFVI